MMEFDPNTVGNLVYPLIRLGVGFAKEFLNKERPPVETLPEAHNPIDNNRKAAWDLYVEMETRITTQPLDREHGDEKTALDSVYSLFKTTRKILLAQGPDCVVFAKIAIEILNQKVRPFTAEWHRRSIAGDFENQASCDEFRDDLESLQEVLRAYTLTLAVMAGIEDISHLSEE